MGTVEDLDATDLKILRILQEDSRLTVKELAEKINLSPSPTSERQKRFEREGYIERYMAVVNADKVGNHITVLCNVRLARHTLSNIKKFSDAVMDIDQITECYETSGEFDFQIKVLAKDMKDYQQFMLNTLGNIEGIGNLHSYIVVAELKNTHGVPINSPQRSL